MFRHNHPPLRFRLSTVPSKLVRHSPLYATLKDRRLSTRSNLACRPNFHTFKGIEANHFHSSARVQGGSSASNQQKEDYGKQDTELGYNALSHFGAAALALGLGLGLGLGASTKAGAPFFPDGGALDLLCTKAEAQAETGEDAEVPWKATTLFNGTPAQIRSVPAERVEFKFFADPTNLKLFTNLLRSEEECESTLKDGEFGRDVDRPQGVVRKVEAHMLRAGDPTEDRWTMDLVTKTQLKDLVRSESESEQGEGGGGKKEFWWKKWWDVPSANYRKLKVNEEERNSARAEFVSGEELGKEDIWMFSVIDGHGGDGTADIVNRTLHGCLGWNLGREYQRLDTKYGCEGTADSVVEQVFWGLDTGVNGWLGCPHIFEHILQQSFLALDKDIIQTPYNLIYNPASIPLSQSPWLPPHAPSTLASSPWTWDGACALTAIVDTEADMLYVAHAGDSRAMAGWYNQEKGVWRCDVLTADQTGDNPDEIARIRSEHPDEDPEVVMYSQDNVEGTRILGGLQPTRAFGDADFKLSLKEWKDEFRALMQKEAPRRWSWFAENPSKTPPYVTAKPEVISRKIHPKSGDELKFLLLATDGLFDRLTSEEASHLLAAHLNKSQTHQQDVRKADLLTAVPHMKTDVPHPYPEEGMNMVGSWVFEDDNSATHLIRNALGGSDRELRRQFLSLRKPGARKARDDTTAIVVWFDTNKTQVVQDA